MRVNVIFAGLQKDQTEAVLKRMEAAAGFLGTDLEICALNLGGTDCQEALGKWLGCYAGSRLYQVEGDALSGDQMLQAADAFCREFESEKILVAPTDTAKRLGQRLAAKLQKDCLVDVNRLEEVDQKLCAVRKIYSTHLDGFFPLGDAVILVSQSGPKADFEEKAAVAAEVYGKDLEWKETAYLLKEELLPQVEDLSKAKVVFLGGKGLENKANFERMEALAAKLGASCGCTRAVAMAGWASYDQVVGISGWKLQADVCIAFGVSGAGPLLQGLEGVGKLTAVNNDKKAPIFRCADYGVVEDCMKILDAMENAE